MATKFVIWKVAGASRETIFTGDWEVRLQVVEKKKEGKTKYRPLTGKTKMRKRIEKTVATCGHVLTAG